jgi:hypothetical protein
MANPNQSEKSVALDREENITRGNLSAKKVALYIYNSDTDQLEPYSSTASGGGKATDAYYYIQKDTDDATYKYYGYMKDDGGWFIKRITIATNLAEFVKGTSGYTSEWTNRASQTYGDYAATF